MSISARPLIAACAALLLLIAVIGAGVWWYLFGPNQVDSADLVPANTLFFASIPNAATLVDGFGTSKLRSLLDNPNSKAVRDSVVSMLGGKNAELLRALAPNLSGQSFIAVTHFEADHPERIGLIAAMKPKAGLGDFGSFVEKLKQAWPDAFKQAQTGKGTVDGVSYDWIRGPGATEKICVAQVDGWIVTTWGETPLQDWLERFYRKSNTTSLAQDANFQKTMQRVGDSPMALTYVNLQAVLAIAAQEVARGNPVEADYLSRKLQWFGGAAVATRFENGEIVDRYSVVFPKPAQVETGMQSAPCAFDTLRFTGTDTRFYWASGIDWQQYYLHVKRQISSPGEQTFNPAASQLLSFLHAWAHGTDLDVQRNIVDALGPEISMQVDWPKDDTFPSVGLLVKLGHPADFKPTIDAIREMMRQAYATSAVIKENDEDGQKFATLQFNQGAQLSPTMSESGVYFGIFTTQDEARLAYKRDRAVEGGSGQTLADRPEFTQQIGDLRAGATQIAFLDSPYLIDRTYRTAMPYLSLAGMFDKRIAAMTQSRNLPENLDWLQPIGTWSCVVTPDEEGIQAYSVSGIGNQGILISGLLGQSANLLQTFGYLPKYGSLGYTSAAKPPDAEAVSPADAPPVALSPSTAPLHAVIFITIDNKILFNETTVPQLSLTDFLKSQRAANGNLDITVRVDQNASPDVLSAVMDAAMTAGFGELPYTYTSVPGTNPGPTGAQPSPAPMTPVPPASTNALTHLPSPGPLHP